jgi:hypothetical protein
VLTNGTVVANGWSQLTSGTLLAPITRTQTGALGPTTATAQCGTTQSVWTGTFSNGSGGAANITCSDWTSTVGQPDNGLFGDYSATDSDWTFVCTTTGCSTARPVYCVEQ